MISRLRSFLDSALPPVFTTRPKGVAPWFYDYFNELDNPDGRLRYARALALDLRLARVDVTGQAVLDAGSGFGVTLMALAALGARLAVGLEAFAPMAASARVLKDAAASGLPVQTVRGSVHTTPLATASLDFIYCNEALSHFLDPSAFLSEAHRILRTGGVLMICDGNNGANPTTVAEVHQVWRAFEEGPGERTVHGHRIETPYREIRRRLLAQALPHCDGDTLDRLAWGTFGLHGNRIEERARDLLREGSLPQVPPAIATCPVDPIKGDHIENLIYPDRLRRELEEIGFEVRVYAHFGGARSRLIETANRVLRALTPLTLSRARSLKIVAHRRP